MSTESLLAINNLTITVQEEKQNRLILNHVSFEIAKQSIVGLVGGSGSGKTTTGLAILGLLSPTFKVRQGEIFWEGQDLLKLSARDFHKIRGKRIGMVFQEPLNAFNPVFTIGHQIAEVLQIHSWLSPNEIKTRALELLNIVGIQDERRVWESYPHQLSGGMRQRAMIAQAIAAEPSLLIADEPTSNLDVTLQAKIMELFEKLRSQMKLSILLITHDLGMVEHLADTIAVMCAGEIIEKGARYEVTRNAQHAYTQKLLKAFR